MEDLYIEGTSTTPEFHFKSNGELEVNGKSIPANASKMFEPVLEWLQKFSAEKVELSCKLEYFNTSTSKVLYDMLKDLESKFGPEKLCIKWYYEEGDEDVLETGHYYESLIKVPFEFYMMSEFEMMNS